MPYGEAQIVGIRGSTQGLDPQWGDPKNLIDRRLDTRWSCSGAGSHVIVDLGGLFIVHNIDVAWYRGNERANDFYIEGSQDGISWTPIHGTPDMPARSSGTTLDPERYDIDNASAKFIRITGVRAVYPDGSSTDWISMTEIFVFADHAAYTSPHDPVILPEPDIEAPVITITSPVDCAIVKPGALTVRGTVTDSGGSGTRGVAVNSEPEPVTATINDDGTWSAEISITEGKHEITAVATDGAGNFNSVSISVLATNFDIFGIKKIYETRADGREIYMNMKANSIEEIFPERISLMPTSTIKNPDGSWSVSRSSTPRWRIGALENEPDFDDIEVTWATRYVSGSAFLQVLAHGERHTNDPRNAWQGSANKLRLIVSSVVKADYQRELFHENKFDGAGYSHSTPDVDIGFGSGIGKYITWKAIFYKDSTKKKRIMEIWVDKQDTNDFELVYKFVDEGKLSVRNISQFNAFMDEMEKNYPESIPKNRVTGQPVKSNEVIIWGSRQVLFRTDRTEYDFRNVSVRDI